MKRPLYERVIDRLWCEVGRVVEDRTELPGRGRQAAPEGSISGGMKWPAACAALASGRLNSRGFRRRRAVREVVETLAPSDGRHFARWLAALRPELLEDPKVRRANNWGDPIQAPGWALGTARPWSPTSLRYLAHTVWIEDAGLTGPGRLVVEVGVGFGGFGSMVAAVSGGRVLLVDLPDVEACAALQMRDCGFAEHLAGDETSNEPFCFVSNYAFTELARELQDEYIERFASRASSGLIVSNANLFASRIGGRSNQELVTALRASGVPAKIVEGATILGPSDVMCGNQIICWGGDLSRAF